MAEDEPALVPDEAKARLTEMRAALVAAGQSTSEDRAPVELDQTRVGRLSRMDALQVQAMAQAQEGRRVAAIRRIDAALDRITKGDYGFCTMCDEPIGEKRLRLDPAVPTCIDCAKG